MTVIKRKLIADANARAVRAELAALHAEIRLCIARERLAVLRADHNQRHKFEVQIAAKRLAKDEAGEIHLATQFNMDPSLIHLATTDRVYRARVVHSPLAPAQC